MPQTQADPVAARLQMAPATNAVRASAWDAFQQSANEDDLAAKLKDMALPDAVKADLWDLKHAASAEAPPRTYFPPITNAPKPTLVDRAVSALPAVAGVVGGIVGGIGGTVAGMGVGGVPGAIGGAALGGGAGEAAKELINRARGAAAPATSGEAAKDIGVQALVQGGAQAAGEGLGAGMKAAAPWLMQKALKPTASMLSEYKTTAPKLVQTLLDDGISVTQAGIDKLQKLFDATNKQIADAIGNASGSINKQTVAARALTTANKVAQQVNPEADLRAVGDTVEQFVNHPVFKGNLSIPEAQAMKVGTYQQVGRKYGEVSSAAIETQKALARGLKEEIASEVPGIGSLNLKDSELMAALDAVGRRVALSGNKDPVGFAWVAAHPTTFLASLFDRSPAVKSMVARGMYKSAGAAAKVAPQLIRAAVVSLSSLGSDDAPVQASGEK